MPAADRLASPRVAISLLAMAALVGSPLLLASAPAPAEAKTRARPAAKDVQTMPVSEIRRGMRGHALTVFHGNVPDKFEIEVVDIIPKYLPKQDAVLFRSSDPRLQHSGIVGGMSGSPIFLEGKLVGALSYGWRFNKDPLGALTPIANMKEVGELPYRPDVLPQPSVGKSREGTRAWADVMLGLDTSPLPARARPQSLDPSVGLAPLATPLSVAGFGPTATRMLADQFGMTPVRGGSMSAGEGGEGKTAAETKRWQGGDAVSVVMIEGDNAVAGNGTVTWVSPTGDRLLAFGHSMFDDGPTNVPMADAHVHTIINSVDRSVKVSSPKTIRGVMYQDRQAAIALRTDARAPMLPVTTTVQGADPDLAPRIYHNTVAFGVTMTPNLVGSILAQAVDEAARDATEVVLTLTHDVSVKTSKGPRDIHIEEEVFFPRGTVGRVMRGSRGVLLLAAMLDNDFEIPEIIKVEQNVNMTYGAAQETIENVRLANAEVRAGDLVRLELTLRDYDGDERTQLLPIRVPDDAGGQDIVIELSGGVGVAPYRPIPASVDDLIGTIEATYPARSIVATIYREGEGLSTRGELLHSLPDSVLETLRDQGATRDSVRLKQMSRRVIPTAKLIEGEHTVHVHVLPPTSF